MTDSERIDALFAVCAGLEARIAQMEQAHKADRERLNRLEGRESRAQNLSGDVRAYLDMTDAPEGSPADVGAL